MRGILLDWLVQVHGRFQLLPETLFLCMNIIDRFLSAQVVSLAKLQLVGITYLFISSKVEEIVELQGTFEEPYHRCLVAKIPLFLPNILMVHAQHTGLTCQSLSYTATHCLQPRQQSSPIPAIEAHRYQCPLVLWRTAWHT